MKQPIDRRFVKWQSKKAAFLHSKKKPKPIKLATIHYRIVDYIEVLNYIKFKETLKRADVYSRYNHKKCGLGMNKKDVSILNNTDFLLEVKIEAYSNNVILISERISVLVKYEVDSIKWNKRAVVKQPVLCQRELFYLSGSSNRFYADPSYILVKELYSQQLYYLKYFNFSKDVLKSKRFENNTLTIIKTPDVEKLINNTIEDTPEYGMYKEANEIFLKNREEVREAYHNHPNILINLFKLLAEWRYTKKTKEKRREIFLKNHTELSGKGSLLSISPSEYLM